MTHEIVWLEEYEVNGEKVLVPVLYLAHADNRLAPTGALIAGNDLSLITGQNLTNVGTLKATNNLSASAGNDLVNSGLLEAGNRLDLLAGNDVVNKAGGIIAGRDVSVTAIGGDVINERSVTSAKYTGRYAVGGTDFADSAARIEAANDLRISAGRDVSVTGGVLQSGRDTVLDAGRDVNLLSVETVSEDHRTTTVTQLAADVASGRDLKINAARDVNAIASQISAKRDIAASAGEDLTISSAADEYHYLSKSKKLTIQKDEVRQVSTNLEAGGNISLVADKDLAVISSRITAANEAYLVAGENLDVLAAQDSDYSLYDKKKKGSWGKKKTQRDEVTDVRNVGSEIKTGGDLLLVSGGDQKYQAAKLESGEDLTIESGGAVTFEGVKDLHQESHEKSKSSSVWFSNKGRGKTDETLRQSELTAQGEVLIQAVNGLHVDVRQITQESVSQSIDAMVKADPKLAWLKEVEQRGDVDWRQVKEIHDSFKYANSGMGPAAQLVVAIMVAAVMGPAGFGLSGMPLALATSVGTNAATSAINNKGDLDTVFKDVTSSDAIKGYAVSGIMAGFVPAIDPANASFNLDTLTTVSQHVAAEATLKTAIMGGSLKDNLGSAALGAGITIGGAKVAGKIGDSTIFEDGKITKVAMHAALGGLMAEALGGDFRTGALAAGANELVVDYLADKLLPVGVDRESPEYQAGVSKLLAASQLIGALTAAGTGGDASAAAEVAANGTQYNNLDHPSAERLLDELQGCRATKACSEQNVLAILSDFESLSTQRSMAINACESRACVEKIQKSAVSLDSDVAKDLIGFLRHSVSYDMPGLLTGSPGLVAVPSQGLDSWGSLFTSDKQIAFAKNLKEGWLTPEEQGSIAQWAGETQWLDAQVGRQLAPHERASLLTELVAAGGVAILGRAPGGGARSTKDAGASGNLGDKVVTVSKTRFPESAQHIEDAIGAGNPGSLTIDRGGAVARRRDSLRGIETRPGLDRDEYPPAMFSEGGKGASVRHISASDNRGAGACIGAQCRGLPDGARVRVEVVD
jgi:filamentous hemagglutinin